ncbi:MAG: (E)-4-hydroxy-3-methylbut-2-enyl-diphosphate synthase [Paludibacteraceae bacterium]|nr:(E)-4-hydroxy-3-methylbut-2-enyl-diphosphate synthase [Paludibacteraceae bacterium]
MEKRIETKKPERRQTASVRVGGVSIGSDYAIRLQTMANVSTNDIDAAVSQAIRCAEAGADLFRFTTQGEREVDDVRKIRAELRKKGCMIPLVADVHFRPDVADKAATVVEKVRINPGNYIDPARKFVHIDYTDDEYRAELERLKERFTDLLNICRKHKTALRLGVNHGSLSDRIMSRYGDTLAGMAESCMEFLRIAKEQDFNDIVLSVKSSNTRVMVETVRLLVSEMGREGMAYPMHLGVTEAGEGEDGRIRSAVGIGALLADGIGDTIRVSLSEEPERELPVARALTEYFYSDKSVRATGNVQCTTDNDCLTYRSEQEDWELFMTESAAECGRLLWEMQGKTAVIPKLRLENGHFEEKKLRRLEKDILQASGITRYKTEFVSCPGCGRTLFDLQRTVGEIKCAFGNMTSEPKKIAVMGCIVNGPGEMADADYGYVGAARGKISLYRGKECVEKNIDAEEAVNKLVALIEQDLQCHLDGCS